MNSGLTLAFLLLICVSITSASSTTEADAIRYLEEFGFKNKSEENESQSMSSVAESYRAFQRMYDLPVTGRLDDATRRQMQTPRCGREDDAYASHESRKLDVKKWRTTKLTYGIRNHPPTLTKDQVRQIIGKAYKAWSQVVPIEFEESGGEVDVVVQFVQGPHFGTNRRGERVAHKSLDSRLGILAHAQFPYNGDLCLNSNIRWATNSREGENLYQTALHEIGHSIGLKHLPDRESIMFAYHDNRPDPRLTKADTDYAQLLYQTPTSDSPSNGLYKRTGCMEVWNNRCLTSDDCCSKNCFRQHKSWKFGVCYP